MYFRRIVPAAACLLHSSTAVEVCDATTADGGTRAGNKKYKK
ncbi:MAG: hypothetical protein RLZZ316_1452 [Bacteroidota bacterium]|jgi:hypothetical protein